MASSERAIAAARGDLRDPDLAVLDVMRTDFRSCNATDPAADVAAALGQSGCPFLPVTRARVPIGIVTEPRLTAALAERKGNVSRMTAEDLMAADPATIPMKAPLAEAVARFADVGGCLLAVNPDGQLMGMLTAAELGPQLSEPALGRLVARMRGWTGTDGLTPPAEAAREADPTAEVKPAKSQAQPHAYDSPTGAHPEPVPLVSPSDQVSPALRVADVMTAGPRTCSPASSVLEAALIFRDAGCGFVPVTEADRPVGVLTDRDVALALAEHETDLARTPVEALMTKDVVTIATDAPLDAALKSLGDHGLRRLVAVDHDGRLAGVLSWPDLAPHLSERGLGQAVASMLEHR